MDFKNSTSDALPFLNQYRSLYSGVMQEEYIASEESACQYIAGGSSLNAEALRSSWWHSTVVKPYCG
jgi:hypothetical protein